MGHNVSAQRTLVVEVKVLQALSSREASGADAVLSPVVLAGGNFSLQQAMRNSSWLQPSARARSPSRPTAAANDGALSARHR